MFLGDMLTIFYIKGGRGNRYRTFSRIFIGGQYDLDQSRRKEGFEIGSNNLEKISGFSIIFSI